MLRTRLRAAALVLTPLIIATPGPVTRALEASNGAAYNVPARPYNRCPLRE